jgi:hypothetical protein
MSPVGSACLVNLDEGVHMPALSHTHPDGVTANEENAMKHSAAKYAPFLIVLVGLAISLVGGFGVPVASAAQTRDAFSFNSTDIAGFPHGKVILTGGGAYVPGTDFAHAGGHFHCTESVLQGPLSISIKDGTPCLAGEGIRWDTAGLLPSTTLSCTGVDSEPTATTGDTTVVLMADFYRQGDGNDESFTAKMAVSDTDLAPNIRGIQTIWIQGVGCGTGIANFN